MSEADFNGRSLYRFFGKPEEADALAQGNVWISTFQTWRRHENEHQGDPGEGFEWYKTTAWVAGHGDDPTFVEYAHRMGYGIAPEARDVFIGPNQANYILPDAFGLSMTTRFDPDYFAAAFNLKATYWCEIVDAGEFFRRVTARLNGRFRRTTHAAIGAVIYRERGYHALVDLDYPPGPVGFAKPPVPYQGQEEVRAVWIVPPLPPEWGLVDPPGTPPPYKPFLLPLPEVAPLIRRII
jgi:hypothetical protein